LRATAKQSHFFYNYIISLDIAQDSAESNEFIAKVSTELGARGTITLLTLPAIAIDKFEKKLKVKKAKT